MGRPAIDPESRITVPGESGAVPEVFMPTKSQPMGIERTDMRTFCSCCASPNINGGVIIWRGTGKRRDGTNYHVICLTCARRIGKAAE